MNDRYSLMCSDVHYAADEVDSARMTLIDNLDVPGIPTGALDTIEDILVRLYHCAADLRSLVNDIEDGEYDDD